MPLRKAVKAAPGFNLNTVLLGIVVALAGWTCKTVVELGTTMATTVEKVSGHEAMLADLKSRESDVERELGRLRDRIPRIESTVSH